MTTQVKRFVPRAMGTTAKFGLACVISLVGHAFLSTEAFAQAPLEVTLTDSSISPSTMYATKGKPFAIHVVNRGKAVHNFVIPAFYIFTANLQPGTDTQVRFTPDKTGSFPYYSDTGGNPEPGLRGSITVQ